MLELSILVAIYFDNSFPGDDQQVAIQVRGGPELLMVTSWVQIVEALPENEGVYTCEASSPRGSVKAEAGLLVRPLA